MNNTFQINYDLNQPYNKSTFITTHNSFVNKKDGWIWYQQEQRVTDQLASGVRAFMIDIWLAEIGGKKDIYLLHGGWTESWLFPKFEFMTLRKFMDIIRTFLENPENPNEIVTIFFETGSTTKTQEGIDRVKAIMETHSDMLFDPAQFKYGFSTTLRDIIESKQRMVILSDYRGGDTHSVHQHDMFGLPLVWHYAHETVYGDASLNYNTWDNLRPESKDSKSTEISLGIVNHFPSWKIGYYFLEDNYEAFPDYLIRFFTPNNSLDMLRSHVIHYKLEHKAVPNFVAVDMFNIGKDNGPRAIVDYCDQLHNQPDTTIQILGLNNQYLSVADGIKNNALIYCRPNQTLSFKLVGTFEQCVLEVNDDQGKPLYLNCRDLTGAVKLYDDISDAYFKLEPVGNLAYKIYSINQEQYMWLSGDDPYIRGGGAYIASRYWMLNINGAAPTPRNIMISTVTGNQHFLTSDAGLNNDSLIYCKYNLPLSFDVIGPLESCVLRLTDSFGQALYLNYRDFSGAVKLYDNPNGSLLKIESISASQSEFYSIYSLSLSQYMWLSDKEPYFTSAGNPVNTNAQWIISDSERRTKSFLLAKIKSRVNGRYLQAQSLSNNELIYCKPGYGRNLEFVVIPDPLTLYVIPNYGLYLNYRNITGAVKLYSDPTDYEVRKVSEPNTYTFRSGAANQYMWLDGDQEPYITGSGKPQNLNAQWYIEYSDWN